MINQNSILGTIRQGFIDAAYIWKQEFKMIFKDGGAMIFLFLLPFAYPLIYASIYNPETPRDIPVAIVDDSRSSLSREYARMLDATSQIAVRAYSANLEEAKQLMAEQKVFAILAIDRNFPKQIYRQEQAHLSLFCNVSSLLYYRNILSAATEVTSAFNQLVQEEGLKGATLKQQSMSINPVTVSTLSLYNPASGFASFIMPAVEMLVIQQSLLLAIGLLAGTQRERNRNGELVPFNHHYFGTFRIITGKSLCYLTIAVITSFWTMAIVPRIFNFPRLDNYLDLSMFVIPFLLASVFLGITLSCLMRGREMPMLFYVFMSIPLLFLSGVSWPWVSIPKIWQYIGALFPTTLGIQGFIQLSTCGATLDQVKPYYLAQWGLAFFYFFTACCVYRYQLQKSMKLMRSESNHRL